MAQLSHTCPRRTPPQSTRPNPPLHKSAVVPVLITAILNGLHNVQVLVARNLAWHCIKHFQHRRIDGRDGAEWRAEMRSAPASAALPYPPLAAMAIC